LRDDFAKDDNESCGKCNRRPSTAQNRVEYNGKGFVDDDITIVSVSWEGRDTLEVKYIEPNVFYH
jgi:hypothetical protein